MAEGGVWGGSWELGLTSPPGQVPCHCGGGKGHTLDKICHSSGEH